MRTLLRVSIDKHSVAALTENRYLSRISTCAALFCRASFKSQQTLHCPPPHLITAIFRFCAISDFAAATAFEWRRTSCSGARLSKEQRRRKSALSCCQSLNSFSLGGKNKKKRGNVLPLGPPPAVDALLTADLWDRWHHADRLAVLASHLFGPGLLR